MCTKAPETNCNGYDPLGGAIPLQVYYKTCIARAWSRHTYQGIDVLEGFITLGGSRSDSRNFVVRCWKVNPVDEDVAREVVYQ